MNKESNKTLKQQSTNCSERIASVYSNEPPVFAQINSTMHLVSDNQKEKQNLTSQILGKEEESENSNQHGARDEKKRALCSKNTTTAAADIASFIKDKHNNDKQCTTPSDRDSLVCKNNSLGEGQPHMSTNNNKECLLPVTVHGREVVCLIDSGSTNCIAGKVINKVPSLMKGLTELEKPIHATAINGSKLTYTGEAMFTVSIQGQDFEVAALYSPDVMYDLVLGHDFLQHNKIVIDFANRSVTKPTSCSLLLTEDVTIPPNCEKIVWGSPETMMQYGDGIVNNNNTLTLTDLHVASVIASYSPDAPNIPVRVLNPHSSEKQLHKSTKIADFHLLTTDQEVFDISNLQEAANTASQAELKANASRSHAVDEHIALPLDENNDVPEDFKTLFDLSKSTFSQDEKEQLMVLLWQFKDIFARPGEQLGCTDLMKFHIDLKEDAIPFKARPYRSNPRIREEISRQVKDMLDRDIIEPSTSQWGSPVLLVTKEDGTYRFCIDYRRLNSMTKIDCYPLNRTDDCLESLGSSNAQIFSSLDLESGYWQMPIDDETKPLTSFVTHDGTFKCRKLAFGLANGPSAFSRLMSLVMQNLAWKIVLFYLDDLICFSCTFPEHLERLRMIFERLRWAKLKLKPKKCHFGQNRIRFLGHYVSKDGIEPMPEKCKAVQEFPTPRKVKDVRSFLGLAGYYRKFIKNFSKIAGPLIDLTKKDFAFHWSDQCEEAFNILKEKLVSPPILAYPNYREPYVLFTDASTEAVGIVLSQMQDSQERVIAYAGKRLSSAERNYSTTEKEALAVIEGLKHFDPYLRGSQVKIVTDHSALTWLLSQKEPRGRLARWIAYLQQFNYTIEHKSGKKHLNADALSRRYYEETSNAEKLIQDEDILPPSAIIDETEELKTNAIKKTKLRGRRIKPNKRPLFVYPDIHWTKERLRESQLKDKHCKPVMMFIEKKELPQSDREAREITFSAESYIIEDGILYHILDSKTSVSQRQIDEIRVCLVIPEDLKHDILTSVHGDLGAGHYGTQRTYSTLRLRYFWKGMYNDTKNWVLSCESCNTKKTPVKPTRAELHPLPPVMMNERWAMDIVTLPLTPRGNRYVLTFTEYNSRYVEMFAMPNSQSKTIARILVDEICFRYGSPKHLLSDLGANLISQVVADTCQLLGIQRLFTAPYRPQTDGLLEKFRHTMCKNLAMYVNE